MADIFVKRNKLFYMRSPRGFYGALILLLVVPVAVVSSLLFGDEETGLHLALAAGAWLMAFALFDFEVDPRINRLTSLTTAGLGLVFLLQALSPLTGSDAAYDFAYDTLGQAIEGTLTAIFIGWCLAMQQADTEGKTRLLGLVTVVPLLAFAVASLAMKPFGDGPPEVLKLLFLPVLLWLMLESREPGPPVEEEHHRLAEVMDELREPTTPAAPAAPHAP